MRAEPGKGRVWGEPGGTPCAGAGGVQQPPWGRTQHLPNTGYPPTAHRPPPSSKAQACQPDSTKVRTAAAVQGQDSGVGHRTLMEAWASDIQEVGPGFAR